MGTRYFALLDATLGAQQAHDTSVCLIFPALDKLDDIVDEYSIYRTTKMKPVDFDVENNDKDLEFKVSDHVRISKYKNIFAKSYTVNRSKKFMVFKKVKNTLPWTYVTENLNSEEVVEKFYEKELQKTSRL